MPALRYGVPDAASDPVVMLHGQPGHAAVWRSVGNELAERGFHALAVDRPGYGRSRRPAVGFVANAEAVIEFLDLHGIERITVVAHSWAGGIALALAARWPERVQGLVLLAPVGMPQSVSLIDRILALPVVGWGVLGTGLRMGGFLLDRAPTRRFLPAGFRDLDPMAAKRMAALTRSSAARRSAATEQRALVSELPDVRDAIGHIDVPTIVMAGSHDLVVPTKASEALAEAITGAQFDLVDAGHLLPSEVPQLVADAVERIGRRPATLPS